MNILSSMEKKILNFLETHAEQSFTCEQLAHHLNYKGAKMYQKLIKATNFLEHAQAITVLNGKYRYFVKQTHVVGTYRANAHGYGFISHDVEADDLFVPRGRSLNAMDGDTVEVEIIKLADPVTGRGSEARVTQVVTRAVQQLVGEFFAYNAQERVSTGYLGYIKPQGNYSDAVQVEVLPEGISPADHAICIVKISEYPTSDKPNTLKGYVVKEIGHKDEPGVDILAVLFQFGIPHVFPENVQEQAAAVSQTIAAEDLIGREDLREELIITIDGADAKDLDDAISLVKLPEGSYRLGVHIADVSHYVSEGSAMDHEAYERGTSVYLTDRVVPMLPQRLSNGICSLHPHEDRLTITCEMTLDAQGVITQHRIYLSVIHSKYRMTYTDVNAILDGDEALVATYQEIVPMLQDMAELHHVLTNIRTERGALDFDAPEAKVVVDATGKPLDIEMRERGVAERLIESFMLAANEIVARTYMVKELPLLYRVHEQPDEDRMQRFAEFITAFGIVLRGDVATIAPKQLQTALAKTKGESWEQAVSTMMLRSMKQAKYSEEPLGHYGLATHEYTHFTSPIRRYPDLIVHRLIHRYLAGNPTSKEYAQLETQLPDIAVQSSKMERRAVEAEREVSAMKKAEYMVDKVGEEFDGVISSVTSFGIFVALPNTVEGLITIKDLVGDYYEFDQTHLLLIGQRTGRIFRIGQSVRIRVEAVNVAEREIDFSLVSAEEVNGGEVDFIRQRSQHAKKEAKASRAKSHRGKKAKVVKEGKRIKAKSHKKEKSKHRKRR